MKVAAVLAVALVWVCVGVVTSRNPEFRAMWVATVFNIDYPTSKFQTTAESQAELEQVVQNVLDLNFNVIIFQVRPVGDALYSSPYEPWSEYLTGEQGVVPDPLWDPLQYLIDLAHPLGIQVHAWVNPYRANMRGDTTGLDPSHMCFTYSDYCYSYGTNMWMDPGVSVVQDHSYMIMMDILERYDVDGIHIDDYFYPYPLDGVEFPDDATYQDYLNQGGSLSLADWRRDNNNRMVERWYAGIKSLKPEATFSVSPFGIYRPCHPEGQPCSIIGFDQYEGLYADPKLWLQEGWLDIMMPQLYWEIDPPAQSFTTLLDWWDSPEVNLLGKAVAPGIATYKVRDAGWPNDEISRQVEETRSQLLFNTVGSAMFSYQQYRDNVNGIATHVRDTVYQQPADVPDTNDGLYHDNQQPKHANVL